MGSSRTWMVVVALAGGALGSACPEQTAIDLTIEFDEVALGGQPDTFEISLARAGEVLAGPVRRPEPSAAQASGARLVMVVDDALAGESLDVVVDAYRSLEHVASGDTSVVPALHITTPTIVQLGAAEVCGDGRLRAVVESCDDGNTTGGDGCSSTCRQEQHDGGPGQDAGPGPVDGGDDLDAGLLDGGPDDGGPDVGPADGGPDDGGPHVGPLDGGPQDGGPHDGGLVGPAPLGWIAHWSLDGTFADTGGVYGLTPSGPTTTVVDGPVGSGQRFRGGAYAEVASLPPLGGATEATVALWFRSEGAGLETPITMFDVSQGPDILAVRIEPGPDVAFEVSTSAAPHVTKLEVPAVDAGRWHHIAVIYEGAGNGGPNARIYLDGILVEQGSDDSFPMALPSVLGSAPWTLSSSSNGWEGALDDVFVYARALTEAEVVELVDRGTPGPVAPPTDAIRYFPFDDDANDVIEGQPGTLSGDAQLIPGALGQALRLGETGDGANLGALAELNGATAFSVAMFHRARAPERDPRLFRIEAPTHSVELIVWENGGQLGWNCCGGWAATGSTPGKVPGGVWQHTVATWQQGELKIYLDGVSDPIISSGGTPNDVGAAFGTSFTISDGTGRTPIDADEVYVFDRVLEPWEVTALYDAAPRRAQAPTDATAHWAFEGDLTEASGLFDGSQLGAAISYEEGVTGRGARFVAPARMESVLVPALSSTSAFATSFWFSSSTYAGNQHLLYASVDDTHEVHYVFRNGDLEVEVSNGQDDGDTVLAELSLESPESFFHHLAVSYDGTLAASERVRVFVDGERRETTTPINPIPSQTPVLTGIPFRISNVGGSALVDAKVDEYRVFDHPLTEQEVVALYELDRARPPWAEVLQLRFEGDLDAFDNDDVCTGSGTVGYELGPRGQALTLGPGSAACGAVHGLDQSQTATVSMWLRQAVDVTAHALRWRAGNDELTVQADSGSLRLILVDNGTPFDASFAGWSSLTDDNLYHHVVFRFDATAPALEQVTLHIDGIPAPVVYDGGVPAALGDLSTGVFEVSSSSSPWSGGIDDLQVYGSALEDAQIEQLYLAGELP